MALKVVVTDEQTGLSVPEAYIKINQFRINKPNGYTELVAESAQYVSKTAKDDGKKPVAPFETASLGKMAYADGSLEEGDVELPQNVQDAIGVIFAYGYAQLKEVKYSGAVDV